MFLIFVCFPISISANDLLLLCTVSAAFNACVLCLFFFAKGVHVELTHVLDNLS